MLGPEGQGNQNRGDHTSTSNKGKAGVPSCGIHHVTDDDVGTHCATYIPE